MQNVTLKCRGLYTYANLLGEIPDGALTQADNIVIDRDGVAEPRRGFPTYGSSFSSPSTHAKQLMTYKGRILRHWTSTVEYDSDGAGTFSTLSSSISEPTSGIRIKYVEANGNFYFTSSAGIKKISATSASNVVSSGVTLAGGIKAIDGVGTLNSQTGFFTQDSQVAYRIVWGLRDSNNNVILGVPSERIVVANPMIDLLIGNFNTLVNDLTIVAGADPTQALQDTTYIELKISGNSSALVLYNSLISLASGSSNKLDVDLSLTGESVTTTIGLDVASITSTQNLTPGMVISGNINIPALTTVAAVLSPTTFRLSAVATGSATTSTDFGSVTFQNITPPTAPSTVATTAQLVALQTYFDAVVDALNVVEGISSTGRAAIGGFFDNSTQSATVDLTFTIPSTVTTSYFYQVYRSSLATSTGAISISDVAPDDELNLVFEDNPTSGQISAKSIVYHDIVPDAFRVGGTPLYTNAISGEGINQANEVPPLAQDIALYKGSTFYANTKTKHSLQISLLSAIGLNTKVFTIKQGATTNTYTFVTNTQQVTSINAIAGNLFTASGTADYFDIRSADNVATYRVWFSIGTSVAPSSVGVTLVQCTILNADTADEVASKIRDSLNTLVDFVASASTNVVTVTNENTGYTNSPTSHVTDVTFTLTVSTSGAGEDAVNKKIGVSTASTPAQEVDETARSLCRVLNKNSTEVVYAYYISGVNDVPGMINLETRSLGTAAFYLNSDVGSNFSPTIPVSGQTVISDNQVVQNRLYWSKYQQPEAVPAVNFQDVGPKDKAILRILPLRDSLFILSEDGIYRLSGLDPSSFQITLFDNTTRITASDSAAVLNNQIFVLTDQGVVSVSDTGVSIISRPIEDKILPIQQYTNFQSATFAVPYATDRAYLLWTVTNSNDTVSTQCFRFNTFTNTWVRWPISKTCGVVPPETNVLYLGAGDTNFVEKERKSFSRLDHADRQYDLSITAVSGDVLDVVTVGLSTANDTITQTQYLTIAQFNRLLSKLNRDPAVNLRTYNDLAQSAGSNIRTALTNLASVLDTDTGINDSGFSAAISGYSSSFVDCQSAFNVIVNRLNTSSMGLFRDYSLSAGTVTWEVKITAVGASSLTTEFSMPMIIGPIVLYKHILSQVTWAPHAFGDPSLLKHISESTIMFKNMAFSTATAAYSGDLSTGFESTTITGEGTGIWGGFAFGQVVFGGEGSSRPFRTLVPTKKQRSRFINCQFTHASALEEYSIFGLSYSFIPVSNKAYR